MPRRRDGNRCEHLIDAGHPDLRSLRQVTALVLELKSETLALGGVFELRPTRGSSYAESIPTSKIDLHIEGSCAVFGGGDGRTAFERTGQGKRGGWIRHRFMLAESREEFSVAPHEPARRLASRKATMPALTPELLTTLHPRLYHMAAPGSWPTIHRHGLLSTAALLDLFETPPADRERLLAHHRPATVPLTHPLHGTAHVRDQKPMSDTALKRALRDDLTPTDWYRLLNARVFFWLTQSRLDTLLRAAAYRDRPHTILVVDTASLLARHAPRVELSPINSGSTVYNPAPRGRDTFLPIAEFPFDHWAKKRSRTKAIAELTVLHAVPDLRDHVLEVYETGPTRRTLFSR
jgi:hypothetical protein